MFIYTQMLPFPHILGRYIYLVSTIFRKIHKLIPQKHDLSTFLAPNESSTPCSKSLPSQESHTSLNKIRRKGGF